MIYKSREIEAALKKKGFEEIKWVNHKYYYFLDQKGNQTPVKTKTSHGDIEYGGKMLSLMKKQLHLNTEQFDDLVKCPLTEEQLREIYNEKHVVINKLN